MQNRDIPTGSALRLEEQKSVVRFPRLVTLFPAVAYGPKSQHTNAAFSRSNNNDKYSSELTLGWPAERGEEKNAMHARHEARIPDYWLALGDAFRSAAALLFAHLDRKQIRGK